MPLDDVEVSGASVSALLKGLGSASALAHRLLADAGIGAAGPAGQLALPRDAWYPISRLLRAMKALEAKAGQHTLYQVGLAIAKSAKLAPAPAAGAGIAELLRLVDISYHLNHRKGGEVMFDQPSGELLEGIGHYSGLVVGGKKLLLGFSDTPYPCDLDHGLLSGLALLAEANAVVSHESNGPCRKNGAPGCTYQMTWL